MKEVKIGFVYGTLRPVLLALVLAAVAAACSGPSKGETPQQEQDNALIDRVVGIGRVEPASRIVDLAAEVSGIVRDILVLPGEILEEGRPILVMDDDVEKANVEIAGARIEAQQYQVQAAESRLSAKKIQAVQVTRDYRRAEALLQKDATSRVAVETVKTQMDGLNEDIQRLSADLLFARRTLRQLQAELKLSQARLRQKTIRAPAGGRLLSLDIPEGTFLLPGATIGQFAPGSDVTVWCEIDELFADRLRTGQAATVRRPGMLDDVVEGTVTFIGPWLRKKSLFSDDVGELEDRRVREVRVTLRPDTPLLLGSRVECVIFLNASTR